MNYNCKESSVSCHTICFPLDKLYLKQDTAQDPGFSLLYEKQNKKNPKPNQNSFKPEFVLPCGACRDSVVG